MNYKLAFRDIKIGLLRYRVWLYLGWSEIKQRYRRSIIGPCWISLSMLIFIAAISVVFSRLFNQDLEKYIPYFTSGFLFWTFISNSIIEAAEVFRSNGAFIKQINLPLSLYIHKHLCRQVISLLHNFFVYFVVCIFFRFNPGWHFLLLIPGFFVLLLNLYWISFFIAIISSRFRDMVPIITSCMQIAFFVTPISWMRNLFDQNSIILTLNPFAYLLDIVRSPLLGQIPEISSWYISLSMILVGCSMSLIMFSKFRPYIVFWVD